jgi:hypothetical protein
MKFPIGFSINDAQPQEQLPQNEVRNKGGLPASMVLVRFPSCNIPLSYYNDRFDLKPGDIVFVEGKYEGTAGRVEKVTTDFHVNLENYKRILGVADTFVQGTFYQAGASHLITFDPDALPYRQVLSWYKPISEEDFYINYEEDGFSLYDVGNWPFPRTIFDRGVEYYKENKVVYLSLENGQSKAIVTGTHPYEVAFTFRDGQVSGLKCDCPCGYGCKHEVAALFQLREILDAVEARYPERMTQELTFAGVFKGSFFSFAVDADQEAALTLT